MLQPIARISRRAADRLQAVRKDRTVPALTRDLVRLARTNGLRGLLYRASYEAAQALGPPPAPAPPPVSPSRIHTHAFDVALHPFFNPTEEDLEENRAVTERFGLRPERIRSATWFMPYFKHAPFGGSFTILRCMNWLTTEKSVHNRLVIFDNSTATDLEIRSQLVHHFPALRDIDIVVPSVGRVPFMEFSELPPTDIAVCTIWLSAYALLRFNSTKAKFYFVQDYEPAFYPAGTLSALSEATYRFGFAGLVNTPGLEQTYRTYGNPSSSFIPAVDDFSPNAAKPSDVLGQPVQIVMYGRPGTDRNAFELLVATCLRIKQRFGARVRIVSAGEEWDPAEFRLNGIVENLGLLKSHENVHKLYCKSDIGLFCMMSKHPSYQPFEYLAAGVAVVTNRNPHTEWLLRDRENALLVDPFPVSLADAVAELVEDRELRLKLARAGAEEVGPLTWTAEFDRLWGFMTARAGSGGASPASGDHPRPGGG